MHHFFAEKGQVGEKTIVLTGSDVHHARQVLRIRPGEEILISDGTGGDYRCLVRSLNEQEILAEILCVEKDRELPSFLVLYQSLVKGEKMEWIIQKAVELGVSRIVPVASENVVVKLEKKKEESRCRRWQAIAESAAKQSKRSKIPKIGSVLTLKEALNDAGSCPVRFFAYEHEDGMQGTVRELQKVKAGQAIAVFVGPEGGYSPDEVKLAGEYGILPVSLGRRILRAETAGLALLSVLMMNLECAGETLLCPQKQGKEETEDGGVF